MQPYKRMTRLRKQMAKSDKSKNSESIHSDSAFENEDEESSISNDSMGDSEKRSYQKKKNSRIKLDNHSTRKENDLMSNFSNESKSKKEFTNSFIKENDKEIGNQNQKQGKIL